MKISRKIIEIDEEKCDGCGLCVPSCAEGAIQIINGKAKLVAEKYCDGLGSCLGECPRDAIHIVEKEVEDFDEEAAQEHMATQRKIEEVNLPTMCPSARLHNFAAPKAKTAPAASQQKKEGQNPSALSHWPVQIRLVPPHAPFLKDADLLVAADCTPIAYADFHQNFLQGKVVMMGCPKFDDTELYAERFCQIFRQSKVKSVTILIMEVPCCSGLPSIVKKALEKSGNNIPLEIVTISLQGKILQRNAYPEGILKTS